MILKFVLFVLLVCSCMFVQAQDSLEVHENVGVIRVKKPTIPEEISVVEIVAERPEDFKVATSASNELKEEIVEEAPEIDWKFLQFPQIYSGELALLDIQTYRANQMTIRGDYLIFRFMVNKEGKVSEIEFKDDSQHPYKKQFKELLESSRWHPAIDTRSQESVDFWFPEQIVKIFR